MHDAEEFPPPQLGDARELAQLASSLRACGFTEAAVAATEQIVPNNLDAVRAPAVRRVLAARNDAAGTLIRLFLFDTPVLRSVLADAIGAPAVSIALAAGLVVAQDDHIVATGRVVPFLGAYIAGDRPDAGADAAMAPGPTTHQLGAALPPEFAGRVLDVATGPGSLAIVAAMRGGNVVGTDISERALAFARFNAALNDVTVDFRVGSMLDPVRSETFDLVVAQPPYVARPADIDVVTFAHGGSAGDELALGLLGELGSVLASDGIALVRFDTPRRDTPIVRLVRDAVGDEAVDVAVLQWPGASAAFEAVVFGSLADWKLGAVYTDAVNSYGDHLEALGIDEFVQSIAVLRATESDAPAWTAGLPLRSGPGSWVAVASYLLSLDAAGLPDGALEHRAMGPNPGVFAAVERALGSDDETFALDVRRGALAANRRVDANTLSVLDTFGDVHTPGAVITALSEAHGLAPDEARATVLSIVREALAGGHLVVY